MAKNIKKRKLNARDVSYLNRDFESFRNELIRYSRVHYGNTILDFSEASLAGMFVDMAAYVGDMLSFYQDHQFNELSLETASETRNVERLIRDSGLKFHGASPSYVEVDITLRVPAVKDSAGNVLPDKTLMPFVKSGTVISSTTGVEFELLETINFAEVDEAGELVASIEVSQVDSDNMPTEYFVQRMGRFTSSKTTTETLLIGDEFVPFRTLTLKNADISEIISVKDTDGDEYYEVDSLTQDTVFIAQDNDLPDFISVNSRLKMTPAPKRFEKSVDRKTRKTTLRFGAGNEDIFDEDVVPDPSEHAIKFFGDRKSLPFVSIDPNSFLTTQTLGISPRNTTLTIRYRSGGGVKHNVAASQVNSIRSLITKFDASVSPAQIAKIRSSAKCINQKAAAGGENQPTLEEFRQIALSSRNSQSRIVTKEDLLARVYSLPNRFGRIFRAGVRENPNNPFSTHLHVLSRDADGKLIFASDTLKENMSQFLENYRLITDAIDIVDGRIINVGIDYAITVSSKFNPDIVLQSVNMTIQEYMDIKNFQIDMPLYLSELQNLILNTEGVVSLLNMDIVSKEGIIGANSYAESSYDPHRFKDRGVLYPAPGGIFEVKFPNDDIKGIVK
tara:strand:- start:1096 stop:2946 length:1851 start_codon:yes stop_codon:yes gene_type:complete